MKSSMIESSKPGSGGRPAEDLPCILVDERYVPDTVTVAAGETIKLVFRRRDRSPCSETLVFPAQGLRWRLTRRQAVVVELPPCEPGEYAFHCGMEMMRGRLVVR